jgi:hypothetical protein
MRGQHHIRPALQYLDLLRDGAGLPTEIRLCDDIEDQLTRRRHVNALRA